MKKLFMVLILLLLYCSNLFSVYYKIGEIATIGDYPESMITGNLVLVGNDTFGLQIYEISNPATPVLLGSVDLNDSIREIQIKDNFAYIFGENYRFYIVDIQDPNNPILLGEDITINQGYHFGLNDSYAYIIEYNDVLEVIDISNPQSPEYVTHFYLPSQGISCSITNELAFVTTMQGLHVYDISNPLELVELNWFDTGNTHSPIIRENYVYFSGTSCGLGIVDFTNPTNIYLSACLNEGFFYDSTIQGNMLFGLKHHEIKAIDISSPFNLNIVSNYITKDPASHISSGENTIFIGTLYEYLSIINVSDPVNDLLLEDFDVKSNMLAKSPDDEFMLVYGRSYDGLNFFKMDDPLNPEFLYSHISHGGQWGCKAFYIDNEIACSVFGTFENAKFYVYDLSNLEFLTIPGIINLNYYISNFNITSIDRKDNYVYLATSTDGLIVIDISDPENPVHIFNFYINGFIFNLTIKDDYLYFVNIGGLRIFDISNPLCPIDIGYWNSHNRAEAFALLENYAYVADYDGGVKVIDISDPTNPILVNTLILNYNSKLTVQPIIRSNKLFISDKDWNEIFIYDLTNPANPFFQSSYRWNKYSNDMEIFDNYLYSANGAGAYHNYGLSILDFSEFITKTLDNEIQITSLNLSNYPNPFNPITTISFSIPDNSKIKLSIYNIKGQKVRAFNLFPNGSLGTREVIWNGTDENNQPVSSGIYFYELNVNGKTEAVKKCLLLK